MSRPRVWNAYAEEYDLVVDTIEEFDLCDQAARELSAVIDGMPGWLVGEIGLDKALDTLNNVTLKETP